MNCLDWRGSENETKKKKKRRVDCGIVRKKVESGEK